MTAWNTDECGRAQLGDQVEGWGALLETRTSKKGDTGEGGLLRQMTVCKDKENQLPGFRLVSRKTLSICNIAVAAGRG